MYWHMASVIVASQAGIVVKSIVIHMVCGALTVQRVDVFVQQHGGGQDGRQLQDLPDDQAEEDGQWRSLSGVEPRSRSRWS